LASPVNQSLFRVQQRQDAVLDRLQKTARLYLRGMSQKDIAKKLGVSRYSIGKDLIACRKMWREKSVATFEQHLAEQLAKLDEAEAAAWVGWERSLQDEVVKGKEEISSDDGNTSKVKKQRRGQSGSAIFIATITRIIEMRCRLLGLLDKRPEDEAALSTAYNVVSIVVENREQAEGLRTLTAAEYTQKLAEANQPK
jgi:transcriptional regulator with XRE-family HTH domain